MAAQAELLADTRGYRIHQVGDVELLLAQGKRVSGDPRIEQAVLTGVGLEPKLPQAHRVAIGIGGGTTPENVAVFVSHLKGDKIPVTVTTPTKIPEYQFGNYREQMMHAGSSEPFHVGAHSLPFEARVAFRLGDGTFTTGGNQERGRQVLEKNGLVDDYTVADVAAGTSAGWHMLAEVTSCGKEKPVAEAQDRKPQQEQTEEAKGSDADAQQRTIIVNDIIPGVGVLKRVSGDSHFRQRSRGGRSADLVAKMTEQGIDIVSLGVSEASGVIVLDDRYVEPFGETDTLAHYQRNGVVGEVIFERGSTYDILALPRETTYYSYSSR